MQPLFDNLKIIRNQFKSSDKRVIIVNKMLEKEKLLMTLLAYIEGRGIQKSYLIFDEEQNLKPCEVKTVITRAGNRTKVIFTGDIHQIDHPYLDKKSNRIAYLINRMKGPKKFGHIILRKGRKKDSS